MNVWIPSFGKYGNTTSCQNTCKNVIHATFRIVRKEFYRAKESILNGLQRNMSVGFIVNNLLSRDRVFFLIILLFLN